MDAADTPRTGGYFGEGVAGASLGTALADFAGLVRDAEGALSALAAGVRGRGAGSGPDLICGEPRCERRDGEFVCDASITRDKGDDKTV